jgi:hypothetical protein
MEDGRSVSRLRRKTMTFLEDTFRAYRRYRQRVITERVIGSLPPEVRKDIGWPDTTQRQPMLNLREF